MHHYTIRQATAADEPFLWDMLFYAATMAADGATSAEAAQADPFLSPYVAGWGRPDDLGLVAEDASGPLGAAWLRLLSGSGHPAVDPAYPELAIAVQPGQTGRGIGGALLGRLIELAGPVFPGIALSVRESNPASRLYARHGFVVVDRITNRVGGRSLVMALALER